MHAIYHGHDFRNKEHSLRAFVPVETLPLFTLTTVETRKMLVKLEPC